MTQTLGMRATSFGASAALLGLAVFAAFSATISLRTESVQGPASIPIIRLAPPDPPTVVREQRPPPPAMPQDPVDVSTQPPPLAQTPDTNGVSWQPRVETGPAVITNPRWVRQPRDLESYYPSRALARDITGQVVLDCLVDVDGVLTCAVVSETPVNWGFGSAALRIARDYRMVPAMRDGQAVEGRYRMRVPFEVR